MVNQLRPRLPKVKNFISLESPAPNMTYSHDLLATYRGEEPDVQVEEDDPLHIINIGLQPIQDERATHMTMVPTHLVRMLALLDVNKYNISSMKLMWYGASAMLLEVLRTSTEI